MDEQELRDELTRLVQENWRLRGANQEMLEVFWMVKQDFATRGRQDTTLFARIEAAIRKAEA